MPDPTLPDDELLRTAKAYVTHIESQPPPRNLEDDARRFVFSRRRRVSLVALLGGGAVVLAATAAAVVALAFHHGPQTVLPAATPTPSMSVAPTPTDIATPTPSVAPTATPVPGLTISSAHLRLTVSYPPPYRGTICRSDGGLSHPFGSGTDVEIEVGPAIGTCPVEGFDQPFLFQPHDTNPYCSGSGNGCRFDPAMLGTHGCVSTRAASVDGVAGTRSVIQNRDPNTCFPIEGQGDVDVIYFFHTNGVYWSFEYHRTARDADLTATFDRIVATVRFHG